LLTFAEQVEQVNSASVFKIEIQITVAAALSATSRSRQPAPSERHASPSQCRHGRVLDEVKLNVSQDLGWQFANLFGKDLRFNEFKPDSIVCFRHVP
jgi:hypothetical protein